MQAIREIVNRDTFKNFEIPKEFGDRFEMILLPIENTELRIENDGRNYFEIENKVLMKYQEENGFSKNVLADKNEDVWNEASENEQFLAAAYDAVIEDNDKEDEIWSKYL